MRQASTILRLYTFTKMGQIGKRLILKDQKEKAIYMVHHIVNHLLLFPSVVNGNSIDLKFNFCSTIKIFCNNDTYQYITLPLPIV